MFQRMTFEILKNDDETLARDALSSFRNANIINFVGTRDKSN